MQMIVRSPNNSCCQRFDRKTGFVGGKGGVGMKCKNPQPEDIGVNHLQLITVENSFKILFYF